MVAEAEYLIVRPVGWLFGLVNFNKK